MNRRQIALIVVSSAGAFLPGCGSLSPGNTRDAVAELPGDGFAASHVDGAALAEVGGALDGVLGAEANQLVLDADVLDGAQDDAPSVDLPAPAKDDVLAVRAVPEPWGKNCPRGGVKIESGVDLDRNGLLDPYEVVQEQYVCNVYPMGVSAGPRHSCALASSGAVWCWGADDVGQLGDFAQSVAYAPRPVEGAPSALALDVGRDFGCVILPTTGARCWGRNDRGQGGHGVDPLFISPSCVSDALGMNVLGARSLSLGGAHACIALNDGTVDCWGANDAGQVGDGTTIDRKVAVPILGITGVQSVAAGDRHTCALLKDTTVRCWGANEEGQLGNGTTGVQSGVVTVGDATAPLSGVVALTAGDAYTCALMQDASVSCWGANSACQLGQPATTRRALVPTATPVTDVQTLAAGAEHVCAVLTSGKTVCWGKNDFGQTGTPAGVCRAEPVALPLVSVVAVSAGRTHSCAVDQAGIWCWGDDSLGQLGIGIASADRSSHVPQLAIWHLAP